MGIANELSIPFDKAQSHKAALVFKTYSIPKMQLLKACFDKEWLLMQRNSFIYIFKTVQIIIGAFIASTVFLRTELNTRNADDGALYVGALIFVLIINMFNGFAELSLTIARLPVFYKHRDLLFHPAWTFTLPSVLLGIPISIIESTVWTAFTYYVIGFAPEASRYHICLCLISFLRILFIN